MALRVAFEVIGAIRQLPCPGEAHLRDHLVRAAKNTGLALSEASGSTGGNRRLHLERAYSENQEVQSDLEMLVACGIDVPDDVAAQADRLGGLIYGLLRSCIRDG